jgi:hypothetical protein
MNIELTNETIEKIEKLSNLGDIAKDCIIKDISEIVARYVWEYNTQQTRDQMNNDINEYLDKCLMPFIREERLKELGL